jgi:hypothetical protein
VAESELHRQEPGPPARGVRQGEGPPGSLQDEVSGGLPPSVPYGLELVREGCPQVGGYGHGEAYDVPEGAVRVEAGDEEVLPAGAVRVRGLVRVEPPQELREVPDGPHHEVGVGARLGSVERVVPGDGPLVGGALDPRALGLPVQPLTPEALHAVEVLGAVHAQRDAHLPDRLPEPVVRPEQLDVGGPPAEEEPLARAVRRGEGGEPRVCHGEPFQGGLAGRDGRVGLRVQHHVEVVQPDLRLARGEPGPRGGGWPREQGEQGEQET